VIALLVYMPLHIFLSQSLSMLTGGLEVWKVAKDAALLLACLFTICLVYWEKKGSRAFWVLSGLATGYALVHLAVWALNPDIYGRSAGLGLVFNLRLPLFALLGYGAYLLTPAKFAFSSVFKIIIGVSSVVVLLGLLQYLLPKDVLTHLGYSIERGVRPAFFIDDNPAFPRIMSTLREPNSLAAYLLVPIGLLSAAVLAARERATQIGLAVLLALHVLALYLTHSRSALLALVVVLSLVGFWQYREQCVRLLKRYWPVLVVLAVLGCAGLFVMRNEPRIKGLISHSTPDTGGSNDLDSNDYHWIFIKRGLEGIADQPLGHGPGTAGLASIQNPAGSFLTENYYVQVGYETGIIGLAAFIAINVWLYLRLRRGATVLHSVLLATFWGYVIINMLLHIWANEAVAAQWWLLAGIALGLTASTKDAGKPNAG
jgi:hypothetical protein